VVISMVDGSFSSLHSTARAWHIDAVRGRPPHQILSTLMSAFPSSRRANLWLQWKQLVQALPGKAGVTAVMTTVDHTLMRGLKPDDR